MSQTTARTLHSSVLVGLASAVLVGTTLAVNAHVLVQPPTFYLCEANVADISTRRSDERFLVTVRLTKVGTEQWAAFTTERVTHQVQVNVGPVLLIEAEIRTPITSGLLEIARVDRASAEDVREAIVDAPEYPCGAYPSG